MVERRRKLRLALEALEVDFARGQLRRQNFDDDRATEALVRRPVDSALPARAELFRDAIIEKRLADHKGVCDLQLATFFRDESEEAVRGIVAPRAASRQNLRSNLRKIFCRRTAS